MGRLHAYVGVILGLATVLLVLADWTEIALLPREAVVGLIALTVLGIASEAIAFSYKLGRSGGSSSLAFIPLVTAAVLFGPVPALLFILITATVGEFLVRRKEFIRASFNVAQYVIVTAVSGILFQLAGGYAIATAPRVAGSFDPQLWPVLVFGGTLLLLNHVIVAVAIALSQRESVRRVIWMVMNRIGGTFLNNLMILPLSVLVAFLYFELGVTGLFVALLPLIFIRHSYLANFRLEAANRDLLQVLVKAIETRDPYTSGHSLRVQALAKAIAESIGMGGRQMEQLETAALLHDIGKIEVVYEKILQKPGDLSEAERKIIESHVHRGVEILTSLSSFDAKIVAAVRHHHELFDGSGYPDGLAGERIPLFARIIKMSDAIDAMLSTRPYRGALPIEKVKSELIEYAGRHFDPRLVSAVVSSSLLEEHAASVELDVRLKEDPGPARHPGKQVSDPEAARR